jgi:hypothetical protein
MAATHRNLSLSDHFVQGSDAGRLRLLRGCERVAGGGHVRVDVLLSRQSLCEPRLYR